MLPLFNIQIEKDTFCESRCFLDNKGESVQFHNAITAFFLRLFGLIEDVQDKATGQLYRLNKSSFENWKKNNPPQNNSQMNSAAPSHNFRKPADQVLKQASRSSNELDLHKEFRENGRYDESSKNSLPLAQQGDYDFAINCCAFPMLATYIRSKTKHDMNSICRAINQAINLKKENVLTPAEVIELLKH